MNIRSLIAGACALAAGVAAAETTPVMVSLVTPVQAPSRGYDVCGLRLSLIYGDCHDFTGLDIGLAQRTAGEFTGVGVGGVNIAGGRFMGGQLGLVNWSADMKDEWGNRSTGLQFGLLNYSGSFVGLQDGLFNVSTGKFVGLQDAFVNYACDIDGLQCGFYFVIGVNVASGTVRGCQIGLVNFAETMECGLQIGLVNVIAKNGWLPVLPIVNGNF